MDISRSSTSTSDGPPPGLQVVGLDRECCFTLPTPRKINSTITVGCHDLDMYIHAHVHVHVHVNLLAADSLQYNNMVLVG